MDTQIVAGNDNLQLVLDAIDNNVTLKNSTKHQYRKAILNYVNTGNSITDAKGLITYSKTIGSSTRSFLSAVITLMTKALELEAKSQATPENINAVQAIIYQAQALRESVKVEKHEGTKAHTWLTQKQVVELFNACTVRNSGNVEIAIIAQRDKLAIGLLVGAGLRRLEAVSLTFKDVVEQSTDGKTRTVLNVTGKGAKDRIVPISKGLAQAIRDFGKLVNNRGRILRSLGRNKQLGQSMTTTALYNLVQKRGRLMGKDNLQPHDMRRSFAQIAHENDVSIAQISLLLGHNSIETTMRYLNIELDLDVTASDFIPFV